MKLEICIDRISSAIAAVAGGADRIEVCSALESGGITPSYGLVEQCVQLDIDVAMMIRPHGGSFCYQEDDIQTMLRDINVAKQLGVSTLVWGALSDDGNIDRDLAERLIEASRPLRITFHRAFDLTPNPLAALDTLLELGIDHVLTSGQAVSALEGAKLIGQLVARAGVHLTVIAGGGIEAPHVQQLVRATGVRQLHASARSNQTAQSAGSLGLINDARITSSEKVRALATAMKAGIWG